MPGSSDLFSTPSPPPEQWTRAAHRVVSIFIATGPRYAWRVFVSIVLPKKIKLWSFPGLSLSTEHSWQSRGEKWRRLSAARPARDFTGPTKENRWHGGPAFPQWRNTVEVPARGTSAQWGGGQVGGEMRPRAEQGLGLRLKVYGLGI